MNALQMLLRVSSILGARQDALLQPFAGAAAAAGKLNRQLSRAPMVQMTPGASLYLDWFMLDNVNHYFKGVRLVHGHLDLLRACFARVGELEADIALARHLLTVPALCWAERHAHNALALDDTVHPLLPQAQALSVSLAGGGAFVSGQNGIGKSTLLRTVGMNLVTARAFGFCYARKASVPDLPVYTSMQSEDSLFGGESLYMAELRRAQELLAAADGPHPGICIIDEIFRGTNHLESVSAAAAVLDVLASKGLVMVSSHNLVLASLLAQRLAPLCMRQGADWRLVLEPGVLAHTNGIALLAQRGFGPAIEDRAGRVFDWLNGYLAHPGDCDGVLTGA
jgi:DNA mismatch repair ATPase MutS